MVKNLVAMAHVDDVAHSIRYYTTLGFTVENSVEREGQLNWAWLTSERAQLMLARASEPVDPGQQAVLFYLYVDDVAAEHARLDQAGFAPGEIKTPFYSPRGEFRLQDPDGYVLMIAHFD
jgi:hypothetical protein